MKLDLAIYCKEETLLTQKEVHRKSKGKQYCMPQKPGNKQSSHSICWRIGLQDEAEQQGQRLLYSNSTPKYMK